MINIRSIIIIFSFCLLSSLSAAAYDKACTLEEAKQAESEAVTLKTWDDVYNSFNKFAHCDDASIGEGYSDSICRLLANDWRNIDKLNNLTLKDKRFKSFILKHIDETAKVDDMRKIFLNATKSCDKSNGNLCKSLVKRLCALQKEDGYENITKWSILNKNQIKKYCK